MGETIIIAGLSINKLWLVYGIGFLLAYILFRKKDQQVLTILFNMLLITLLFWKFGAVLFDPGNYFSQPTLLLQSTGAKREIITGIIAAVVYLIVKNHKNPINIKLLTDLLILGFLVIALVKNLFIMEYGLRTTLPWGVSLQDNSITYHPVNWYRVIFLSGLLMTLWRLRFPIGSSKQSMYGLFYWGLGNMLTSLLVSNVGTHLFLTSSQWLFFLAMLLGLSIPYLYKDESESDAT